jgi:hypothetical protein
MGRVELLRAELAAAELEADLVALKNDPKVSDVDLRAKKDELREARRVFRTLRAGAPPEDSAGDATVRPAPVKAKAGVKTPGGKG